MSAQLMPFCGEESKPTAHDWLATISDSRYCELVGKWFADNPAISRKFFDEAVIPAAERAA